MKFRYSWLIVLFTYYCTGFFNELKDQTAIITSFKIEKSKNPSLSRDYEGLIDTYNNRVVIDFKSNSIAASTLSNLIPTVEYLAREIYPNPDDKADFNGTTIYTLKTLKREKQWKITSCCLNSNSGPSLSYVPDWEHTFGITGNHVGFGDGIIKSDGSNEKLYLFAYKNITTIDESYLEKINLTTGATELTTTLPWALKSVGDKYLSPAMYVSLYDGSNIIVRQINTHTLNTTVEATLNSMNNMVVLSVPNSGGTRVKGITANASSDARTFNIYDPTGETATLDCGAGTTETNPILGETDYIRETYFMIGTSINCGGASSGTDIFVSRWNNSFGMMWKTVLWSSNNDALPQIGNKRSLLILPDGSLLIGRYWSNSGIYNAPGKFDLNGNDITSSSQFPNFHAYYLSRNLLLVSMTLYNYNNASDIFYAAYNTSTAEYSIHRTDINGNIRNIDFSPAFSVGCNANQQTITVSVDSSYNLYFNCLKTNTTSTYREFYVKKFKATVNQ